MGTIIDKFKNPVSTIIAESYEEDNKKRAIKLAITSAIMSLINIISIIIGIIKKYSKNSFFYSSYSSSQLWDVRWKEIKNAELFGKFFSNWIMFAIVILIFALILFVINKLLKKDKDYLFNLSLVNNAAIIYVIGTILSKICSLIYLPLGILCIYATTVYGGLTLLNAFKDSLELEDSNKLVLVSTGVLVVTMIILVVVMSSITGVSLKDITNITELFGM